MDDRVRRLGEGALQVGRVADVAVDEVQGLAGELLHPLQGLRRAVAQVVQHGDLVAGFEQGQAGV